jgi:folate-dependent phosphoribosylglycinamide formyltransferase PurN
MLKLCLFTANKPRHKYLAEKLNHCGALSAIVCQPKYVNIEIECLTIANHLQEQTNYETRLFGNRKWLECPRLDVRDINDDSVMDFLRQHEPNCALVFGTKKIEKPIIDFFAGKIVNLHLGLSPYYRGSASNFWAIHDELPECVGATLHTLTEAIDSGEILMQTRPVLKPSFSSIHEIGTQAFVQAVNNIGKLNYLFDGSLLVQKKEYAQANPFRRYTKISELTHESIRKVKNVLQSNDFLNSYLAAKTIRDAKFPIKSILE